MNALLALITSNLDIEIPNLDIEWLKNVCYEKTSFSDEILCEKIFDPICQKEHSKLSTSIKELLKAISEAFPNSMDFELYRSQQELITAKIELSKNRERLRSLKSLKSHSVMPSQNIRGSVRAQLVKKRTDSLLNRSKKIFGVSEQSTSIPNGTEFLIEPSNWFNPISILFTNPRTIEIAVTAPNAKPVYVESRDIIKEETSVLTEKVLEYRPMISGKVRPNDAIEIAERINSLDTQKKALVIQLLKEDGVDIIALRDIARNKGKSDIRLRLSSLSEDTIARLKMFLLSEGWN